MHADYHDIIDKIKEPPQWWDEAGVPRYCKFTPRELHDGYADECCLMLISCQQCGKHYKVAASYSKSNQMLRTFPMKSIAEQIKKKIIHWGDPPFNCHNGFCSAGYCMNCYDLQILEYWNRNIKHDWRRNKKLEIELPDM